VQEGDLAYEDCNLEDKPLLSGSIRNSLSMAGTCGEPKSHDLCFVDAEEPLRTEISKFLESENARGTLLGCPRSYDRLLLELVLQSELNEPRLVGGKG
jgi:hypothetical protein